MTKTILALITMGALTILSACSTPYQEEGFMGGVSATMLDGNTAQIAAKGNGYTSAEKTWQHALLKSAETTLANGYGHFALVDSNSSTKTSYNASTYNYGYNYGYGNTRINSINKPRQTFLIRMFPGRKPANAPGNVFDAQSLKDTLYPQLVPDQA